MKFMSFNVRYSTRSDGQHAWVHRKHAVTNFILDQAPAIFGLQEVLPEQRKDLELALGSEYRSVGLGRDPDLEGEQCPIFFRNDRFVQLDTQQLWLSDTPTVHGSKNWSHPRCRPALPRIFTCLRLLSAQRGGIYNIFNTHFDHQFPEARTQSVGKLMRHVQGALERGERVVVMGDLNANEDEECLVKLEDTLQNAYRACNPDGEAPFTYHGFRGAQAPDGCHIDYIFFDTGWNIEACSVHQDEGPHYLSDHFPILAQADEAV